LNCGGKLIPAIDTIAASLYPLSDDWLAAISYLQRAPHETEKATLFVIKTLKLVFCDLKGENPLN
jgi:hypothetical protein